MPKSTSQISPRRTSGFTGRLSVIAQPLGPAVALFLVEHLKKCGRRGTEESALIQTLNQLGLLLSREAFDGGFDFGNRARAVTITGTSIARKSEAKRPAVPKDRTLELFFPLVDSDLRGRRCCRKEPADSRRGWERDFFASAPSKATALEWRPLRLRIKIRE